jgi:hypothetical protein
MLRLGPRALATGVAILTGVTAALVLEATSPAPNAQPSHGTEGAFASGLHPREIVPGRGPQRWTRERSVFRFERLPEGPASLEVRVRGQRTPLRIVANGTALGEIPAGRFVGRYPLPAGLDHVTVELATEGFPGDDGERRGALVDRVKVLTSPGVRPAAGTVLLFLVPALVLVAAALVSGLAPSVAALVSIAGSLLLGLALWTDGQLYSPYARSLAFELAGAPGLAALAARSFERRAAGAGRAAFAALLLAFVVQGIAAASPVMVSSDVVFHANRLRDAAGGEFFPTSVTQHQTPFRIPYGVSFYALLAPLAWLGLDPVVLVSAGAGLAGIAASWALFGLLARRDVALAGAAVVALQLLPGTFSIHSYGNLSNAFGQAATVLFVVWWAGAARGGWALGGALFALVGVSHLSCLIVLGVVSAALLIGRWPAIRSDRTRLGALGLGTALVAAYYARFLPLIASQLPRLLEGGGQGHGPSRDAADALRLQLTRVPLEFGLPALLLALLGLWSARRDASLRDFVAYAAGAALLALPAVVSPLEVRYLYALGLPVAVFAGLGFVGLRARGRVSCVLAWSLAAVQAGLAFANIGAAIFERYRQ